MWKAGRQISCGSVRSRCQAVVRKELGYVYSGVQKCERPQNGIA